MKKNVFYFSHDYFARNDPKLLNLRRVYGMEGLGIYWCLVEIMYEQEGKINLKDIETIAFELRTECERIASIINDFDLFIFNENYFTSKSVLERLKERENKSNKARQSAIKRWGDANALRTHCEGNAIKERKGKERKRNILKENSIKEKTNYAEFVTLTEEEFDKLVKEHGRENTATFIETLNDYKGSSGKKYKGDYYAIRKWVIKQTIQDGKYIPRLEITTGTYKS